MTPVKVSVVLFGQMDLLVVCVLVQVFAVTLAYRYDPNLADLPLRDYNKEFDIPSPDSWNAYNRYPGDIVDSNVLGNQKRQIESHDVFDDVSGEARSRQLQHELRYIVKQLEKLHPPERQSAENLIHMKQPTKPQKRQSGSGAQICIWKVCPPSPWRRSGGKY